MAIRFARGILRLWVVLSAFWIAGVAIETWWTFPVNDWVYPSIDTGRTGANAKSKNDDVPDWARAPTTKPPPFELTEPFDPSKPYQVVRQEERQTAIWFAVLLALMPPAVILVLGSSLAWAFRGFRQ